MAEPVRPEDMPNTPGPKVVIKVWNHLIGEYWDGKKSVVPIEAMVAGITSATGLDRKDAAALGFFDLEPVFQEAGWEVFFSAGVYTFLPNR